ncbi:MAG TPA: TolC family protein, partial [Fimbriiglobus sp.]|nr:TolC family protein [Fimbriiglobus sp.]
MRQHRRGSTGRATAALALAAGVVGCVSPPPRPVPPPSEFAAARPGPPVPKEEPSAIRQASFSNAGSPLPAAPAPPFAGADEITAEQVVSEVLARSPTLAQMAAAWQAASARYPQVTALDDPRVGGFVGPGSFGTRAVDFAYRAEVSQAFPFPGKRQLRGQGALHEAAAAGADLQDTRLQLAEAARSAFAEYFLAARATEVNEENRKLLGEFRQNAVARFRTGQTSQQDVLQADVALARQSETAVTLSRRRAVAQARINTLMHLPPDSPLPPPPKELDVPDPLAPAVELRNRAVGQRPDVVALEQRLAAEQAAVALAIKEFKPDFEAMAGYDAFWQERQLRPMV